MKKIVSVLALSALVAGSVFAQAKISMNYRTRPLLFNFAQAKTGDADAVKKMTFLDLDGYAASQDVLTFSIDGENAGVQFAFMPTAITTNNAGYRINTYNAWMTFGDLKIGAGAWKDGFADGGYRVKKDQDAHLFEGIELEAFKLGGAFKTQTTFIDDMVNLAGSSGKLSVYAEYAAKINDDMTLKVLGSAITNTWYSDNETSLESGFGFRVQFNMKDTFNLEAIVKSSMNKNVAAGLYFQPKMVKNLDATVGGAFSFVNNEAKGESKFEGWNADLRVRYQVNEQFSITTYNSISSVDAEKGAIVGKGLAGADGKQGWVGDSNEATAKMKMVLWDTIGARYTVNDKIAAFMNVGLLTPIQKVDGDNNSYSPEWRITPGIQIYTENKAAVISVGVAISGTSFEVSNTKTSTLGVAIPVCFRVKL